MTGRPDSPPGSGLDRRRPPLTGGDVDAADELREWYGTAGLTVVLREVPGADLWAVVGTG